MKKIPAIAAMLVLLFSTAGASVIGLNEQIAIGEEPYLLDFTVENNSGTEKALAVDVYTPSLSEFIRKPTKVLANSKEIVSVKIYPGTGLEGSKYSGRVIVNLGGEITEKTLTIEYFKKNQCTLGISPVFEEDFLITVENTSVKPKSLEFIRANNLPSNWSIESKKIEIGGQETRQTVLETTPGSDFFGKAELVFDCSGETVTKNADVNYTQPAPANTGFAIIPQLPQIQGGIIIDVLLAIVASVLLIAFIARFVKFVNTEAKK